MSDSGIVSVATDTKLIPKKILVNNLGHRSTSFSFSMQIKQNLINVVK